MSEYIIMKKINPQLESFLAEPDTSNRDNAHAFASNQIIDSFTRLSKYSREQLNNVPASQIQRIVFQLLQESTCILDLKEKDNDNRTNHDKR